jgi:hypothetical protein
VLITPGLALAQTVTGGASPQTMLNNVCTFILGPFGQTLAVLGIIAIGVLWMFGRASLGVIAGIIGGINERRENAFFPHGRQNIGRYFGHAFEGRRLLFGSHVEGRDVKAGKVDSSLHDSLLLMRTEKVRPGGPLRRGESGSTGAIGSPAVAGLVLVAVGMDGAQEGRAVRIAL